MVDREARMTSETGSSREECPKWLVFCKGLERLAGTREMGKLALHHGNKDSLGRGDWLERKRRGGNSSLTHTPASPETLCPNPRIPLVRSMHVGMVPRDTPSCLGWLLQL